MKLKAGLWIVVADGARGLILVNEGSALQPDLRALRVYEQDNPKTSEQGRDAPPRSFASVGSRRSAMATADLHQRAEDRFVEQIMRDLAADAEQGHFETAVIVAPPVALGEMRRAETGALKGRIAAWIDKDLTGHPIPEIERIVATALET